MCLCICVSKFQHAYLNVFFLFTHTYVKYSTYACSGVLVSVSIKCQNNLHIRSRYCRFHPYHLYIGTPWLDSGNSPPFHTEPSIIPQRIRDKKKREKGERGRVRGSGLLFYLSELAEFLLYFRWNNRSFKIATSVSFCVSLSLSLSISNQMSLWWSTRSQCTLVRQCLKEKKAQKWHVKHTQCLTHLQMHAASPWEFNEFDTWDFFFHQQSTPPSGVCTEQISGCNEEWTVMRGNITPAIVYLHWVSLPWNCWRREDQYLGFGYESIKSYKLCR